MSDIRIKWLGLLAKLATPGDPVKAFAAFEAYLPFLDALPDEAFTRASLEAVAMAPKRLHIPDLSEVKGPLQAWWRENGTRRVAIAAPVVKESLRTDEISAEEREAVRRQLAALADTLAPKETRRPTVRAHVLPPSVLEQARARLRGVG
jgi:hypothetical protein